MDPEGCGRFESASESPRVDEIDAGHVKGHLPQLVTWFNGWPAQWPMITGDGQTELEENGSNTNSSTKIQYVARIHKCDECRLGEVWHIYGGKTKRRYRFDKATDDKTTPPASSWRACTITTDIREGDRRRITQRKLADRHYRPGVRMNRQT